MQNTTVMGTRQLQSGSGTHCDPTPVPGLDPHPRHPKNWCLQGPGRKVSKKMLPLGCHLAYRTCSVRGHCIIWVGSTVSLKLRGLMVQSPLKPNSGQLRVQGQRKSSNYVWGHHCASWNTKVAQQASKQAKESKLWCQHLRGNVG